MKANVDIINTDENHWKQILKCRMNLQCGRPLEGEQFENVSEEKSLVLRTTLTSSGC